MFSKLLPIFLALFLIAPISLGDDSFDAQIRGKENELDLLRQELAEKRAAQKKLTGEEKSVLSEINDLEGRVDLTEKLLAKLKKKREICQKEVTSLQAELHSAEQRSTARQDLLARRIRQMYMHGRLAELEVFLSAESLPDLASRAHHYRQLADHDRQLICQAQADQLAIAENKSSLEKQLQETRQLEEEKEREERNLKKEKVRRHKLLQDVRSKKAVYEQAIHEMEESARQIQAIIDHLERQRKEAASMAIVPPEFKQKAGLFQRSKGSLPWPLRGKLIGKFGERKHPKYKTVTFNKGIDIEAPYGAEIRAVAAGRAIYTGWLRGYGKFLILDHQLGYYTLYAHTSEILIEEGDIVDAGTVIARVGETGSLEGSKLHFEIRHQKDQLDPQDWLE